MSTIDWDINDNIIPTITRYDNFDEWSSGHTKHVYKIECEDAKRHSSGWAMRNTNNHNVNILKKSCLGVLVCSRRCTMDDGRQVHMRPAICDKARKKQQGKPCPNRKCCGKLEILACKGHCGYPVTHFWRHTKTAIFFQAKGYHDHPKPEAKSTTESRKNMHSSSRSLKRSSSYKQYLSCKKIAEMNTCEKSQDYFNPPPKIQRLLVPDSYNTEQAGNSYQNYTTRNLDNSCSASTVDQLYDCQLSSTTDFLYAQKCEIDSFGTTYVSSQTASPSDQVFYDTPIETWQLNDTNSVQFGHPTFDHVPVDDSTYGNEWYDVAENFEEYEHHNTQSSPQMYENLEYYDCNNANIEVQQMVLDSMRDNSVIDERFEVQSTCQFTNTGSQVDDNRYHETFDAIMLDFKDQNNVQNGQNIFRDDFIVAEALGCLGQESYHKDMSFSREESNIGIDDYPANNQMTYLDYPVSVSF